MDKFIRQCSLTMDEYSPRSFSCSDYSVLLDIQVFDTSNITVYYLDGGLGNLGKCFNVIMRRMNSTAIPEGYVFLKRHEHKSFNYIDSYFLFYQELKSISENRDYKIDSII
jgi:hypothetical protein